MIAPFEEAEIAVAADGLGSGLRKTVFPEFPEPHFTGLIGTARLLVQLLHVRDKRSDRRRARPRGCARNRAELRGRVSML